MFYPVAEEDLVIAVPKGHPLSNRGSISLKELEPYPFISFGKNSGLYPVIQKLLTHADAHVKTICHVEEDNAMAGFVSAGYGVAIMPDFYTLQYYDLDRIPIAEPYERRYLFMTLSKKLRYCLLSIGSATSSCHGGVKWGPYIKQVPTIACKSKYVMGPCTRCQ